MIESGQGFIPSEAENFKQIKETCRATNPEAKVLIENKPFPENAQMIFKDGIYSLKETFPYLKNQEKIILFETKSLENIIRESQKGLGNTFRERQGFLIGKHYFDSKSGLHYEIITAVEHLPLESGENGTVGITSGEAEDLTKKIEQNYPVEYDVLGTYHSHPPGYGIEQSPGDIKTMQSDPEYYKGQVFIIIDPEKVESNLAEGIGIYGYPREGKINHLPTFGVLK